MDPQLKFSFHRLPTSDFRLITDGRFSGITYGRVVGHVAPEAAVGGAIALVSEGDTITIDADTRLLHLHVSDEELERRRASWQPPKARYTTGVLAKYAPVGFIKQCRCGNRFKLVGGMALSQAP